MHWIRNLVFLGLGIWGMLALTDFVFPEPPHSTNVDAAKVEMPEDQAEVVKQIDAYFAAEWERLGMESAERAPSLKIARRLALSLTGTVPSLEEIRLYERIPAEHQVLYWTDRLLEDPRSADYLAERLARAYVGVDNGPFLVYRRRRFVTWLSEQLRENLRYDQLVRRLITAEGLWTSAPEVNFLTVTLENNDDARPDEIWLAGRTARAFLGMRIDCLQCHDDRLGNVSLGESETPRDGTQEDFHQLAAFFSEAYVSPLGIRDRERDYQFKFLDAESEVKVPAEPPYLAGLELKGEDRRARLASWVTHPENRPFARAIVNRMWALLFGRPLVEPLDDIPLHGPFPAPLELLADDFIEHGYDLRRLIRTIAATEVFQLDSAADFEVTASHEYRWAVFPLTRLRPEQVAGSMLQASSLETIDRNSHIIFQLQRYFQENDFVRRYGDTGEDEFADRGGTTTQRLLMMNGNLSKERTGEGLFNAGTRIAWFAPDDPTAVDTAYLAVLSRLPTPRERQHFVARLETAGSTAQRVKRMEDLCWVLFNSTEFSWHH